MYHSIQDIIDICNEENMESWEVVQRTDMDERAASSAESWTNMANMYQAMKDADKSYNARLRSASGLAGGDGEKLGLACDPVCGLVEVPCVKRNVAGAVNAVTAAQMAMAGIVSAIPVDEVIDTMRRIGNAMPESLKETAGGGLATTPTAALIAQRFQKCE